MPKPILDAKIAVALVRVSTEDQSNGVEAQWLAIESWAAREGVSLPFCLVERGVSGATPLQERRHVHEAIRCLHGLRAGVLVLAKRDRLARDTAIAPEIERMVERAGAVVRTTDGASDAPATSAQGIMQRGMYDLFAAVERATIAERTKAALGAKRERGERVSRHIPYGFKLADDGVHLAPVASEQAVIQRARELRLGRTLRAVAAQLSAEGFTSRAGKPFAAMQVARMVAA